MCHVSCVMRHVSRVMCHVSCVMCHVSRAESPKNVQGVRVAQGEEPADTDGLYQHASAGDGVITVNSIGTSDINYYVTLCKHYLNRFQKFIRN